MTIRASREERRFMAAMLPDGTVAVGSSIGNDLRLRGLVAEVRWGRYGLTDAGREAMRDTPEATWNLPSDASLRRRQR